MKVVEEIDVHHFVQIVLDNNDNSSMLIQLDYPYMF